MYPDDLIKIPNEVDSEQVYYKQAEIGQRAREVIENEAFDLAYQELRAYLLVQWQETNPKDTEMREALWHQLQAAGLFYDNLRATMEAGKVATANIEMIKKAGGIKEFLQKVR